MKKWVFILVLAISGSVFGQEASSDLEATIYDHSFKPCSYWTYNSGGRSGYLCASTGISITVPSSERVRELENRVRDLESRLLELENSRP